MDAYIRKVNYHETDKMGITHHSNYIKFMEEARLDFLERLGFGYARLESEGIVSPVISIECEYKKPTTFNDIISVEVKITSLKGVRLEVEYVMRRQDEVVCTGKSRHCFLSVTGKPIALKRQFPELYSTLEKFLISEEGL